MPLPLVRLGDCCDVVSGATPPTGVAEYWDGDIVWLTPKDIANLIDPTVVDSPDKITQAGFDNCSTQMLPKGAILVSSRAPIGHVAIAGRELCTNQGFKSLIPGAGVDSRYLFHCMKFHASRLAALGNGATFKEVSKPIVEDFQIPLPTDVDEQHRIAAILDKADEIRKKRREALELADEFIRSTFVDLSQSRINMASLSDIADIITGFAFQSESYTSEPSDIRLVRGTNVGTGQFDWSETAFYPRSLTSNLERFSIKTGDVLLAMDRPWISSGLKCCVADATIEGNLVVQRVARIRPHSEMDSEFIFRCLNSHQFIRHCRVTETTIPHISPRDLTSFPVPDIDNSEKERFGKIAWRAREMTGRMSLQLAEANQAFNALSHRAFSGQL